MPNQYGTSWRSRLEYLGIGVFSYLQLGIGHARFFNRPGSRNRNREGTTFAKWK